MFGTNPLQNRVLSMTLGVSGSKSHSGSIGPIYSSGNPTKTNCFKPAIAKEVGGKAAAPMNPARAQLELFFNLELFVCLLCFVLLCFWGFLPVVWFGGGREKVSDVTTGWV